MNIEAYDAESLRKLVRLLEYENRLLKEKLKKENIPYDEGVKLVTNALSVLGSDYIENFTRLINSNSVDVYPCDNKKSGAYEWGCYDSDPYVSLNYENNIDSVSTLAHEMGHAMHTYYSNKTQEYVYASYPIFLAEIAWTVNEILLSEYLLSTTNSIDDKVYYLVEFLDKFKVMLEEGLIWNVVQNAF